jgi:hypothetical protein
MFHIIIPYIYQKFYLYNWKKYDKALYCNYNHFLIIYSPVDIVIFPMYGIDYTLTHGLYFHTNL